MNLPYDADHAASFGMPRKSQIFHSSPKPHYQKEVVPQQYVYSKQLKNFHRHAGYPIPIALNTNIPFQRTGSYNRDELYLLQNHLTSIPTQEPRRANRHVTQKETGAMSSKTPPLNVRSSRSLTPLARNKTEPSTHPETRYQNGQFQIGQAQAQNAPPQICLNHFRKNSPMKRNKYVFPAPVEKRSLRPTQNNEARPQKAPNVKPAKPTNQKPKAHQRKNQQSQQLQTQKPPQQPPQEAQQPPKEAQQPLQPPQQTQKQTKRQQLSHPQHQRQQTHQTTQQLPQQTQQPPQQTQQLPHPQQQRQQIQQKQTKQQEPSHQQQKQQRQQRQQHLEHQRQQHLEHQGQQHLEHQGHAPLKHLTLLKSSSIPLLVDNSKQQPKVRTRPLPISPKQILQRATSYVKQSTPDSQSMVPSFLPTNTPSPSPTEAQSPRQKKPLQVRLPRPGSSYTVDTGATNLLVEKRHDRNDNQVLHNPVEGSPLNNQLKSRPPTPQIASLPLISDSATLSLIRNLHVSSLHSTDSLEGQMLASLPFPERTREGSSDFFVPMPQISSFVNSDRTPNSSATADNINLTTPLRESSCLSNRDTSTTRSREDFDQDTTRDFLLPINLQPNEKEISVGSTRVSESSQTILGNLLKEAHNSNNWTIFFEELDKRKDEAADRDLVMLLRLRAHIYRDEEKLASAALDAFLEKRAQRLGIRTDEVDYCDLDYSVNKFRGKQFMEKQQFKAAIHFFLYAVKNRSPPSPEILKLVADCHYLTGPIDFSEAKYYYKYALERYNEILEMKSKKTLFNKSSAFDCYLNLGHIEMSGSSRDSNDALSYLRKAFVIDSTHPRVLYFLSDVGRIENINDLLDYYSEQLLSTIPKLPIKPDLSFLPGASFSASNLSGGTPPSQWHPVFALDPNLLGKSLLLLGYKNLLLQLPQQALVFLHEVPKIFGPHSQLHLTMHQLLLRAYLNCNKLHSAFICADFILKQNPEDPLALAAFAKEALMSGRKLTSQKYVIRSSNLHTSNLLDKSELNQYLLKSEWDLSPLPDDVVPLLLSLSRELSLNEIRQSCLEDLLRRDPTNVDMLEELGLLKQDLFLDDQAEEVFRCVLEIDPLRPVSVMRIARYEADRQEWRKSLELLNRLESFKQDDNHYLCILGFICLQQKKPQTTKASTAFQTVLSRDPMDIRALYFVSYIDYMTSQGESRFIEQSHLADLHCRLNEIHSEEKSSPVPVLSKLYPNDDWPPQFLPSLNDMTRFCLRRRAFLCVKESDFDGADNYFKQALSVDSSDVETLLFVANVRFFKGNILEAYDLSKQAHTESCDSNKKNNHWISKSAEILARVLERMGNITTAESFINTAIKNDDSYPQIHVTKAMLEIYSGRFQSASDYCKKALELNKSYAIATIIKAYANMLNCSESSSSILSDLETGQEQLLHIHTYQTPNYLHHPLQWDGICKIFILISQFVSQSSDLIVLKNGQTVRSLRVVDGVPTESLNLPQLSLLKEGLKSLPAIAKVWESQSKPLIERNFDVFNLQKLLRETGELFLYPSHWATVTFIVGAGLMAENRSRVLPLLTETKVPEPSRATTPEKLRRVSSALSPLRPSPSRNRSESEVGYREQGSFDREKLTGYEMFEGQKSSDPSRKLGLRPSFRSDLSNPIISERKPTPQRSSDAANQYEPLPRRPTPTKQQPPNPPEISRRNPRLKELMRLPVNLPPEKILRTSDLIFGKCLGRGGFGCVYEGKHIRTGSRVAIKKLHLSPMTMSPKQWAELIAEIEAVYRLQHPGLVEFVGAGFDPSCLCIVTELCSNGSLHSVLHGNGKTDFSWSDRRRMAIEMCEAVEFLHTSSPKTVHRDLKSLNIVLDDQWRAKICDFGLTMWFEFEKTHLSLKDGNNGGSPRYMAPECYESTAKINEKVDVWAVGCILIEIFGGNVPFADCTEIQHVMTKLLVKKEGPKIPKRLSPELKTIIKGCLEFPISQRWDISRVLNCLTKLPQ